MTTPVTRTPRAVARPARPRRSPTELPFSFVDRTLAERLAAERDEPEWLRADRLAAVLAFEQLPTEANQLYTPYLDLRSADLFAAEPYVSVALEPTVTAAIPDDVDGLIELDEDEVRVAGLSAEARAAGVILEPLATFVRRDPDSARRLVDGGETLPATDRLAQLSRALWSQGVHLAVPDGVRLDRPILVRWAAGRPNRVLVGRLLVTVGDGAVLSLVEEQVASGRGPLSADAPLPADGPQALFAGTTELVIGRESDVSVASLQTFGSNQVAFAHRQATIGEASSLRWAVAQLGGRLVRSRIDNRLVGDRSSVDQAEIVFGSAGQLVDLTSYTWHFGRDTTGYLLSKGALRDDARSFLKGLITIDRSAVGTDSFLGEFGMNLSKRARAVAVPSLEIDQPDCRRAAHSSSVGPIDETQVFYLESRGIPDDEARKFIVLGFLEPVVARIPLPEVQDRVRELLDEKWSGGAERRAAA
ncbi:MAG TPA: SufD family Fe-S cluster assembly protein [Candidatus Limnocylindrales bacterium]|nr:SufD family Fe-S cluster assembly protein [Candidatus Limnocylindrales bacterium]